MTLVTHETTLCAARERREIFINTVIYNVYIHVHYTSTDELFFGGDWKLLTPGSLACRDNGYPEFDSGMSIGVDSELPVLPVLRALHWERESGECRCFTSSGGLACSSLREYCTE